MRRQNGLQNSMGTSGEDTAQAPSDTNSPEFGKVGSSSSALGPTAGVATDPSSAEPDSAGNSNNDAASSGRGTSDGASRSHIQAAAETAQTSSGASTARMHAPSQSAMPLLLRSNSADTVGMSRQPHRIVGFEVLNHSKGDANGTDSQRPMSSRPESRRSERAATFVALEKQYITRGVQTSAPAAPPVAASCTRHPSLRCFTHLSTYDRFVVPEDSFTDKCGRGKLIGKSFYSRRIRNAISTYI